MLKLWVAVVLVPVLLAGCCFLPAPTKKQATHADVIGTWQYTADFDKTIITIEFKEDGTFRQVVKPTGQSKPLVQDGTWTLDGAHIHLENILTHAGISEQEGWVPEEAGWYLIDSTSGKPRLAIFGGTFSDPDSWQEFKRILVRPKEQQPL